MFGLQVPVYQALKSPDFDDINTILSNSSFSKQDNSNWQQETDEKGNLFYLEVTEKFKQLKLKNGHHGRENSVDDIGYGTDNEFNNCQYCNHGEVYSLAKSSPAKESCLVSNCRCIHRHNEDNPDFYTMDNLIKFKVKIGPVNVTKLFGESQTKPQTYIGRYLCKELLGIIPGHFKSSKSGTSNQRLCIRGIDPTKDVLKKNHVHVGDCLRLINGQEVTWSNVDEVFTRLCSAHEASIVIQQASKKSKPAGGQVKVTTHTITKDSGIVQLLPKQEQTILPSENSCYFMYVDLEKLNSEENNKDEDLLFHFPRDGNELISMRGAFVTIYSTMSEFSHLSTNRTTFIHRKKIMNACYHKEDGNLLIGLFPQESVHPLMLSTVLQNFVLVIRVQYNSVKEAFSSPSNHSSITALLSSINHQMISSSSPMDSDSCRSCLNSVQYLPLDSVFMESIDSIVTGWEALDCKEMSDSYYGCRRTFTVLGSCLFHKDTVLCNHLPHDDLLDVYLYLKYQLILSVCSSDRQQTTVIWREIYPTRQFYNLPEEEPFGYTEPVSARWFWLIVSYKHTVLCTLLETSNYHTRSDMPLDPDPFLIDQAKATLMQIINLNMYQQIDQCLKDNTVSLTTKFKENTTNLPHSSIDLKNNFLNKHRKSARFQRDSSVRSNASSDSGSSMDSGNKRPALYYHSPEGSFMLDLHQGLDLARTDIKLSVGAENCLLHYLHVDKHEGVYITSANESKTDSKVIENFSLACSKIKNVFDRYRYKRKSADQSHDCNTMLPARQDPTFRNIREEGVLFSIPSLNPVDKTPLSYWVVGRQRSLTETYVCFKDGVPQSTVELAFKMAFGIKPC